MRLRNGGHVLPSASIHQLRFDTLHSPPTPSLFRKDPGWCGIRYSSLNVQRIVSMSNISPELCGKCVKLQGANGGPVQYALAMDQRGAAGLDISKTTYENMFPGQNPLNPQQCVYEVVHDSFCSGICCGVGEECTPGVRNSLPAYLLPAASGCPSFSGRGGEIQSLSAKTVQKIYSPTSTSASVMYTVPASSSITTAITTSSDPSSSTPHTSIYYSTTSSSSSSNSSSAVDPTYTATTSSSPITTVSTSASYIPVYTSAASPTCNGSPISKVTVFTTITPGSSTSTSASSYATSVPVASYAPATVANTSSSNSNTTTSSSSSSNLVGNSQQSTSGAYSVQNGFASLLLLIAVATVFTA